MRFPMPTRNFFSALVLSGSCGLWCATLTQAHTLPERVQTALAQAKVPVDAVSVLVLDAQGQGKARVAHRSAVAMNPASVMKLVSTYAALDVLGPSFTWRTPVYLQGDVRKGRLHGNLYIQGQGDPKLVLERMWLLLRRVQGLGIQTIEGDIVLDNSAFDVPPNNPADFDGEPLRPYNAAPDALLLNYKSVVITFTPSPSEGVAHVQFDPALAGVQMQATVPLSQSTSANVLPHAASTASATCGDYRALLKADFSNPQGIRFAGNYSNACGEKTWPVAYADPASYSVRAIQGMWKEMGGALTGTVRMGVVPVALLSQAPAFEWESAPLAEVIRDINKYSNNVMAQQLFLTLGRMQPATTDKPKLGQAPSSFATSQAVVQHWWGQHIGEQGAPVLGNGSGLSRQARISAQALGQLLQHAYRSPRMPELMASLPIAGVDGTLKRMSLRNNGSAHLKTGSLNNVVAVAGYVHAVSGKRYILVAMVNHPNANAARAAIDALVDWTIEDR